MTNENSRTPIKTIQGSTEELEFAARVNKALLSTEAKVFPAEATYADGRVEYRLERYSIVTLRPSTNSTSFSPWRNAATLLA